VAKVDNPFGVNMSEEEIASFVYSVPEKFRLTLAHIDEALATDADTFTVVSDSGEALEYAVPQQFLGTPEGSEDIVSAMDLLTRRHTSGFEQTGLRATFSRPGEQMFLV
jgi:hypothetical protein